MAHNNATEVNIECEKAMTTSLLDLNDFILLQVFSYLNLKDSISFAGTSKRLKSVGGLHFTKYKRLDLYKYERSVQPEKLPIETILSHIAQNIKTLSIRSMPSAVVKAAMDKCVNVTTLKMYNCYATRNLKKWMQQLKLESLTIADCLHLNKMSVRPAALKELHLTGNNSSLRSMQLTNILAKSTELETLTVNLWRYPDFNFDIFTKLQKMKCLDIGIHSQNLAKLTEFLKMDVLTQFKIWDTEGLQQLNSFLEILAERSKLNELKLCTRYVDQNTFRILKSFHHLTSLVFYARDYVDHTRDERWMVHQLVEAQPNLKHLDFLNKFLLIEHVEFVVKNLVKLETFTFYMNAKNRKPLTFRKCEEDLQQLDELRINEMLKTSTSRPMLSLHIKSNYVGRDVKIELRFDQRKHRLVQLDRNRAEDSYFLTDDFAGHQLFWN